MEDEGFARRSLVQHLLLIANQMKIEELALLRSLTLPNFFSMEQSECSHESKHQTKI
jgi:hypothetical protein